MGNIQSASPSEGIGIGIGISAVLAGVGFLIWKYMYNNDTAASSQIGELLMPTFKLLLNIMPFSLFAYGFAGDLINQEIRLMVPSVAALISIILVSLGSRIFATDAGLDLSASDSSSTAWCTLPGLEALESPYIPNAFLSTSIIAFYYVCWSAEKNFNKLSIMSWLLCIVAIQWTSFNFLSNCRSYYRPFFEGGSIFLNLLATLAIGAIIGSMTFGIAKSMDYNRYNPFNIPAVAAASGCPDGGKVEFHTVNGVATPYCANTGNLAKCANGSVPINGKCPFKGSQSAYGGHSQPEQGGGDENTFTAELYKNGQLVTDSLQIA